LKNIAPLVSMLLIFVMAGCATTTPKDYSALRMSKPKSILVVPVVNRSIDVDAPDYFLTTISRPLAERGYYVYPVHAVKRVMEDEGLADADMVHDADPTRLAELFGADSILYIVIEEWDAKYVVLSATVVVTFSYRLVEGSTGNTLWASQETMSYSSGSSSSGFIIADLIANAVSAAVTRAAPNYIPLARTANWNAIHEKGQGLPTGPHHPSYLQDMKDFPTNTPH
jgi:hypothetical protein